MQLGLVHTMWVNWSLNKKQTKNKSKHANIDSLLEYHIMIDSFATNPWDSTKY